MHACRHIDINQPSLTQIGQHSPSGTSRVSPSSQNSLGQDTAKQARPGTQIGQHSPTRTCRFAPFSHSGSRGHNTTEQSGLQIGQHWPGGVNKSSRLHLGGRPHRTNEQSMEKSMAIAVITPMEPASTSKESEILKSMIVQLLMLSYNSLFGLNLYIEMFS